MPKARVLLPLLLALALPARPAPAAPGVTIAELTALPGQTTARAVAVNDNGQVAGTSSGGTPAHGVLWHQGGKTDLGPGSATAMNQAGQVLGLEYISGAGPYVQRPRI